jgi:hypothetical protein
MSRFNRNWRGTVEINHLRDNGNVNFIGDYSDSGLGLTRAVYTLPYDMAITDFVIAVEDVGVMDSGFYGNNITLTNGIRLIGEAVPGVEIGDFLDGEIIMTNADWGRYGDIEFMEWGQGNSQYAAHFHFMKDHGQPMMLPKGMRLVVLLNDDFGGLVNQKFLAMGVQVGRA